MNFNQVSQAYDEAALIQLKQIATSFLEWLENADSLSNKVLFIEINK